MGGGSGGGYSDNGAARISRNIRHLTNRYPLDRSGRFGARGSRRDVRRLDSDDPLGEARKFFEIASRGAQRVWEERPGVFRALFRDGSTVTYRQQSHSDGSPAIDLNLRTKPHGIARVQRIHFIRKSGS